MVNTYYSILAQVMWKVPILIIRQNICFNFLQIKIRKKESYLHIM